MQFLYVPSTSGEGMAASATNLRVGPNEAEAFCRHYSRRRQIENEYKSIRATSSQRTPRKTTVYLFYFVFEVLLYNIWRLTVPTFSGCRAATNEESDNSTVSDRFSVDANAYASAWPRITPLSWGYTVNLAERASAAAHQGRSEGSLRRQSISRRYRPTARTNVLTVTTGGDLMSRPSPAFTRKSVSRQRLYSSAANVKVNSRMR